MPDSPKQQINRHQKAAILIGLTLLTLAVFAQSHNYGFILFDDPQYVYKNPHIEGGLTLQNIKWAFTSGYAANWHPMTWMSHLFMVEFFELDPGPQHILNILLHIACALLLFIILERVTAAPWRSAFVAALFAIHPQHVESVVWITERKDTLSTFFWMLATLAYVRYTENKNVRRYALMALCFALGLMSKPMLVTLPCVFLLMDYWPLKRIQWTGDLPEFRKNALRLAIEKIPMFILVAASVLATVLAQSAGGAVADLDYFSPATRVANALITYVTYLVKTVVPARLIIFYQHPGDDVSFLAAAGAFALLAIASYLLLWKWRRFPYLATGWLWYLGTAVPIIGIMQVGEQARADRYTYVPLIGIFIMIAWALGDAVQRAPASKAIIRNLSIAAIAAFALMCYNQVGLWRDNASLFGHAVAVEPESERVRTLYGRALLDSGRPKEAIREFNTAIELHDNPTPYMGKGNSYMALRQFDLALEFFTKALEHDPEIAEAYNNIGSLVAMRGDFPQAVKFFDKAIELDPDYANAIANRQRALSFLQQQQAPDQP